MSHRIVWEPQVRAELARAFAWYEERSEGLGVRFVHELDDLVVAVARGPFLFPPASQKTRKARVRGWPYQIYFTVDEPRRVVKVIAVWHAARNPAGLKRRLQ